MPTGLSAEGQRKAKVLRTACNTGEDRLRLEVTWDCGENKRVPQRKRDRRVAVTDHKSTARTNITECPGLQGTWPLQ